jgi:hypothetical protein
MGSWRDPHYLRGTRPIPIIIHQLQGGPSLPFTLLLHHFWRKLTPIDIQRRTQAKRCLFIQIKNLNLLWRPSMMKISIFC